MRINCGIVASAMEEFAPVRLREDWDNVGLLVGRPDSVVKKMLLTLDVTPAVIEEAVESGTDLIVAHHPFPFKLGKTIRTDRTEGAMLSALLKNDISVYAAHTNLDSAMGGVNDALAEMLGLRDVLPLRASENRLAKIVVFVPQGHEETVWQAMVKAGAGHVGKYSHCGFRVAGIGTFLPGVGAKPFIGEENRLEKVNETRLETVAPDFMVKGIVSALLAAHPYEEVAYDVYNLDNIRHEGGLGRIGRLQQPLTLRDFAAHVKSVLQVDGLRFAGNDSAIITSVAVCGGSGMDLAGSARSFGANVLVTGDIRYHEAQDAVGQGLCLVDAGHFATEFPVLNRIQEWLRSQSASAKWDCEIDIAVHQEDIWRAF